MADGHKLNAKIPAIDGKVISAGDNTATFLLKRPTNSMYRITALLCLADQNVSIVGMYIIGIASTKENISKISGVDASITRSGDNVTVTFEKTGIWSTGFILCERGYI